MKIKEFEALHNVKLMLKTKSFFMRLVSVVLGQSFMDNFWTTFRLPFQKQVTITYPKSNDISKYSEIPSGFMPILEHELIHAKDMASSWGLFKMFWLVWLLPLPIIFSGRWIIERYSYLNGMIKYGDDVEQAVDTLWDNYLWPWPKPLMRKWFYKKLKEHNK